MNNNNYIPAWPGLTSYAEADRELFFGRDKEIEQLYECISEDSFCTIYGPSGVGKTSLLLAGVFPQLRANGYFPIYIRLNHSPQSKSYVIQVLESISQATQKAQVSIKEVCSAISNSPQETLWEWFHRHELLNLLGMRITPVIVFDQFEELFTLGILKSETEKWFDELSDLCANYIPQTILNNFTENEFAFSISEQPWRVLVCIREDFLARLEEHSTEYPIFQQNRISISPLSKKQALEVVSKAGKKILNENIAKTIVNCVCGESGIIETPMLSLFCQQLDILRHEKGEDFITEDLIQAHKDQILNDFYDNIMEQISPKSREYLEGKLLNDNGYRIFLQKDEARKNKVLDNELEILDKNRIIHIIIRDNVEWIEFSHDILAQIVKKSRELRNQENLQLLQDKQIILKNQLQDFQEIIEIIENEIGDVDDFIKKFNIFTKEDPSLQKHQIFKDYAIIQIHMMLIIAKVLGNNFEMTWEDRHEKVDQKYRDSLKIATKCQLSQSEIVQILLPYTEWFEKENDLPQCRKIAQWAVDICTNSSNVTSETSLLNTAQAWNNLGLIQQRYQQFSDAEKSYKESIRIYRYLEEKYSNKYLSNLAKSINKLGKNQLSRHNYKGSEHSFCEAIKICKSQIEVQPEVFSQILAESLINLGNHNRDCYHYQEAENLYNEAIKIYRDLSEKEANSFVLSQLAYALNSLGTLKINLKHYKEAKMAYIEALKINERLTQVQPYIFSHYLAQSYKNLGDIHYNCKQYDEAETLYNKSIEILRKLVNDQTYAFFPELATSLNALGNLLSDCYRYDEAEKSYRESLNIRRKLAHEEPEAFLRDLAVSLENLGINYDECRMYDNAEKYYMEALNLFRQLACEQPDVYLPALATILNNIGCYKKALSEFNESETYHKEALKIRSKLAQAQPDAFLPDLAMSLNTLGNLLSNDYNRFEEAKSFYNQAIKIRRKLAHEQPEIFQTSLAVSLNCLGDLEHHLNNDKESDLLHKEALSISRKLANKMKSDASLLDIASSLESIVSLKIDLHQYKEAEKSCIEALKIYKNLSKTHPYQINLLFAVEQCLHRLANIVSDPPNKNKNIELAEKSYADALGIISKLSIKQPKAFLPSLASLQESIGLFQWDNRKYKEAEKTLTETVKIYRNLISEQKIYLSDLAHTLDTLGNVQDELYEDKDIAINSHIEAKKIYEKLLTDQPKNLNLLDNYAKLLNNLACSFYKKSDYKKAEKLYKKAIEIQNKLIAINFEIYKDDLITYLENIKLVYIKQNNNLKIKETNDKISALKAN